MYTLYCMCLYKIEHQHFMERRLGHFFLNNEMFFQHQILTFYTQIFQ
jgi:hypothetical protein